MKKGLAERIKEICDKETEQEKIDELKKDLHNRPLQLIMIYALNPHVEWRLPKGEPPYNPANKNDDLQGILIGRIRKLSMFIKHGGYDHVPDTKLENLFIQMLESVDPDDANLLIHAKDKKLPWTGITPRRLEKAWPGFTSEWGE